MSVYVRKLIDYIQITKRYPIHDMVDLSPYSGRTDEIKIDSGNVYILKDTSLEFFKKEEALQGVFMVLSPPFLHQGKVKRNTMGHDKTFRLETIDDSTPHYRYTGKKGGKLFGQINHPRAKGIHDVTDGHDIIGIDDQLCAYVADRMRLAMTSRDISLKQNATEVSNGISMEILANTRVHFFARRKSSLWYWGSIVPDLDGEVSFPDLDDQVEDLPEPTGFEDIVEVSGETSGVS